MKKYLIILLMLTFNFCLSAKDIPDSVLISISDKFIELVQNQKFDDAFEYFDSTMKSAFPVDKFQSTWKTVENQVGKLSKIVKKETTMFSDKKVVVFTGKFTKMYLDIRMLYDTNSKIGGFFFAPNYDYSEYKTPNYVDINSFEEEQVTFGKKGWELKGILTLPKKTTENKSEIFPVVILVHGSGPQDFDESIGPNKPFKDLAWGLASKRIAVFRYNKRTKEHPTKIMEQLPEFTLNDETIADALEAVKKMVNMPDIDPFRMYVLGHSLGGMAIPRIAENDRLIAGYIIMAGNARPLHELLLEQSNYIFGLDGEISDEEEEELDSLETQIERVTSPDLTNDIPMKLLPIGTPASYWLDLRNYYPAQKAKDIRAPLFILQGERDYQVTTKDFDMWKSELKEKTNAKFKLYPKLNHLFMEGIGKSKPDEYSNVGHIPEYVIDDLVKFILKR